MVYLFDIMTKQFCMFVYYDATFKYNIPDKILLGKVKYGFMVDSIFLNIFHINKVSKIVKRIKSLNRLDISDNNLPLPSLRDNIMTLLIRQ